MVAEAAPVVPSRIGRHDVIGYIAAGGMSELFLGRDPTTHRPVVIKRMLPHLARQTSFVSMFIDEARIGAMVHHPNLVEHLELGQVGSELYMVMEYLEGENLSGMIRRLIKRGERLDYGLVAYIAAEACLGLHAAHALTDDRDTPLHIVHRDVSPSNIFVTYSGEVKVLDFGIATAAQRLTQETATGELKGKFAYMSPEQCRGEKLDARSDIFSLGVVLYELGLQKRLFKRENEMLVLNAVCEDPIVPPSREHADYPEQLESVCLRGLARDRRKRYQSAKAMHADLVAVMTAIGVGSDPREALAREMRRLFPERIAEKTELRDQVRAGSQCELTTDVDLEIDVPDATRASPARATSDHRAHSEITSHRAHSEIATRNERPARRSWTTAALSALVVALAVVVVMLWFVRDPAPASVRDPAPASVRDPATASVHASANAPANEARPTGVGTNARPTGVGTNARPADGVGTNARPADGVGTNARPADGVGTNARPADGVGTNARPADGVGTNARPADGEGTRPATVGTESQPEAVASTPNAPTPTVRAVDISIESEPSGTVFVDGIERGASPLTLKLEGERARVEIRRQGYVSLTRDLVLDRDQRLVVTLTRQPRAAKAKPPASPPKPPPAEGFKRFDETH